MMKQFRFVLGLIIIVAFMTIFFPILSSLETIYQLVIIAIVGISFVILLNSAS